MPKLADTLVEGTLGQWLKQVGDSVRSGEPLASIETDKVTTELTSPAGGTLLEVLVEAGQTVPIETPIARIGTAAEAPIAGTASPPQDSPGPAPAPALPRQDSPAPARVPPRAPRMTPVAARVLAEHGVSPDTVPSRSRRVTKQDALAFVQKSTPLTSMRRAIADHMARAWQTIPHGQTVMAADLTPIVAWREQHKDANVTFTAFFVHALARTMDAPANVGVAVALDNGLIVPVIHSAETLSLEDTARAIADVAERARSGRLAPDATHGATMTVTNVGSFGNLLASPIVPLGQLAILGPGVVDRRPLPAPEGGVRIGWQCLLCLVYDRRVFDDLAADQFLRRVVAELVSP
jgi:2-oxoglutarate dehydrogenase E2 component (dihydrolipoamide succinyltransferase)